MSKLKLKLRGIALKLFTSYLTNRYQQTSVDGCFSILELIEWGVPQGSVLGPLLFLIFINDLPLTSNLATWLFADDTVLVHSDSNLENLMTKMNQEVDKIQTWLLANKLSVHYIGKSQFMLIHYINHLQLPENCFELDMGGYPIARTNCYEYLGILFGDKLSWEPHISELCKKLSQIAGVIFKKRSLLSKEALMAVYHSLVGSSLRYGLICWGTANQNLLQKVNVIHNRIVRYLTFSLPCSTAWPLYYSLNILPLDIMIQIEWGKTMYKFQNKMLPLAFEKYFSKPNHQHATRFATSLNFEFVRANSSRDESMLRIIGPKAWVGVPLKIKKSASLQVFIKD